MGLADNDTHLKDYREHFRVSLYNLLQADAAIRPLKTPAGYNWNSQDFTGEIIDISQGGAQLIIKAACAEILWTDQDILLQLSVKFETEPVELTGRIVSVTPLENSDTACLRVQFTNIKTNARARHIIMKIHTLAEELEAVSIA